MVLAAGRPARPVGILLVMAKRNVRPHFRAGAPVTGHTRETTTGSSSASTAGQERRQQTARSAAIAADASSADEPATSRPHFIDRQGRPHDRLPWGNRHADELADMAKRKAADLESSSERLYLRRRGNDGPEIGAEIVDGRVDGGMAILTLVDNHGERLGWRLPRGSVPHFYTGIPGIAGDHWHPVGESGLIEGAECSDSVLMPDLTDDSDEAADTAKETVRAGGFRHGVHVDYNDPAKLAKAAEGAVHHYCMHNDENWIVSEGERVVRQMVDAAGDGDYAAAWRKWNAAARAAGVDELELGHLLGPRPASCG